MSEGGPKELSAAQRKLARSVPELPGDRVAWHLRRKPWAKHLADDLAAVGNLAVEEAARTYSAKHGAAFSTWARSVVDWAILSAIRKEAEHQQLREATSDRRMKLADAAVELRLAYPTVKVRHARILRGLYDQLAALGFSGLG